jgi:hypothetical protein
MLNGASQLLIVYNLFVINRSDGAHRALAFPFSVNFGARFFLILPPRNPRKRRPPTFSRFSLSIQKMLMVFHSMDSLCLAPGRVVRFFLTQYTKSGGKYTKLPQHYLMATKYSKWL